MKCVIKWVVAAIGVSVVSGVLPFDAGAEPRRDKRESVRQERRGAVHRDTRHGHRREYPSHQRRVEKLPRRHSKVYHAGHRYHYHRGVWYRPSGGVYVVVHAPIGAFVRWLPPYHTTVWFHGIPYYYANRTYYLWEPSRLGYVVVEKPDDDEPFEVAEIFAYPSQGQSEEQQAEDRYACHRWAVKETGFDPSLPVPEEQEASLALLRADYRKATTACLEGRGYSVR